DALGSFRAPVVGTVACGLPILAEENIEEYVRLPAALFGRGSFFILRAHGDSMINAGIADGDLVLVRLQDTADYNQIVVALIDDEATLKRFRPEGDRVVLHAENPNYDDIVVDRCAVQGVAVKVIKDLL
ncbi:MAG: repressor LexA, partial [Oscillospiraceae bacterium]|nr:repressor LexA [Oscillospiraceae bacterium]